MFNLKDYTQQALQDCLTREEKDMDCIATELNTDYLIKKLNCERRELAKPLVIEGD